MKNIAFILIFILLLAIFTQAQLVYDEESGTFKPSANNKDHRDAITKKETAKTEIETTRESATAIGIRYSFSSDNAPTVIEPSSPPQYDDQPLNQQDHARQHHQEPFYKKSSEFASSPRPPLPTPQNHYSQQQQPRRERNLLNLVRSGNFNKIGPNRYFIEITIMNKI
ncbi:hypothetical protein BDA99DRAFT_553986 [Phascolomyces articulosus]|uniref:Uncharacterized protein n=1 Tax=Phascolomyces articulosus TaxID=60185 RepID=A0AAD5PKI3_9FUNG|nr:hypothetical protein BDA99DRAFT_553986 [Phascolomyces articulosus]